MGRSQCCEKTGLKKGPWTPEEDQKLIAFIQEHGHGSWRALPPKAGLKRCGKSCRLRWTNYLRPDIKRGKFSLQEEQTIIQLHALLGNRWSAIASHLPKRTDNEIKNYWNTHLRKRLDRMGIDPTTHKPKLESLPHSKDGSNLSHMAQWESARLQAEARLVRESKLLQQQSKLLPQTKLILNKIPPQTSLPPCLDVLKAWKTQTSCSNNDKTMDMHIHMHHRHSMYAMMLSSDDNLESPTSTLCFPESSPMNNSNNAMVSTNHFNDNYLLPPTADTGEIEGGAIMKEANDGDSTESWRYLTKHDTGTQQQQHNDHKTLMYGTMSCLQDDDIMVAVEAFRGVGYHNNVTISPLSTNLVGPFNNDMPVFCCSNENLDIVNGDDGCNSHVNFQENKNHWNSLFGYK